MSKPCLGNHVWKESGFSLGLFCWWVHAQHCDVATEWNGLYPVFGLAFFPREQGWAKTNHVLGYLYPKGFGGNQMTELMQSNGESDADDDEDDSG